MPTQLKNLMEKENFSIKKTFQNSDGALEIDVEVRIDIEGDMMFKFCDLRSSGEIGLDELDELIEELLNLRKLFSK